MKNILIDAGPIIALFDRTDRYHQQAAKFLENTACQLLSTWQAVTEASHMLDFDTSAQLSLLEWIRRGGLEVYAITVKDIGRIIDLTKKYNDRPIDLADASLIVAAEATGIREIVSIDSDFYIYRTIENDVITNVFRPTIEG